MTLFLFIHLFQIMFGIDMLLLCTSCMVLRKATSSEKTSFIIFGIYLERNNCVVKIFFIVCL